MLLVVGLLNYRSKRVSEGNSIVLKGVLCRNLQVLVNLTLLVLSLVFSKDI